MISTCYSCMCWCQLITFSLPCCYFPDSYYASRFLFLYFYNGHFVNYVMWLRVLFKYFILANSHHLFRFSTQVLAYFFECASNNNYFSEPLWYHLSLRGLSGAAVTHSSVLVLPEEWKELSWASSLVHLDWIRRKSLDLWEVRVLTRPNHMFYKMLLASAPYPVVSKCGRRVLDPQDKEASWTGHFLISLTSTLYNLVSLVIDEESQGHKEVSSQAGPLVITQPFVPQFAYLWNVNDNACLIEFYKVK